MNHWLIIAVVFLASCKKDYEQEQLYGSWEIVEINSRGNRLPVLKTLNMKCMIFNEDGIYMSCDKADYSLKGEWMVKGEVLRLHSDKIKDLNGRELDKGHDSEWIITNNEKWMVWYGTSRYRHQHLRIILKRIKQ